MDSLTFMIQTQGPRGRPALSPELPQQIGAEIERFTNRPGLGKSANYTLNALVQGTYKCCKITSINSGKVLDVGERLLTVARSSSNGHTGGGANQLWRLVPVSPDSSVLVSMKSNQVVDVPGHSQSDGTVIVQWGYNGGANQHWRVVAIGRNDYKVESVENGKVLEQCKHKRWRSRPAMGLQGRHQPAVAHRRH
jgi:hypothetical protein